MQAPEREEGELVVTFAKGWAIGSAIVLVVLAGVAITMAIASTALAARLGLGALGLLLGTGGVRQIVLLWRPLVMFAVTREGITTYLDGPRYSRDGFLLPWSEVRSIDLVTRQMRPGNRRYVTVAVEVDEGSSVPRAVSYAATEDDARILHLDATTGDKRGEGLLRAIRSAWHHFGDRAEDVD